MNPSRWDKFRERFLRSERRSSAFEKFDNMVNEEVSKGTIRDVLAIDLLLDIMSLTISAFIVAPMGYAIGECDLNSRKQYLDRRRNDVRTLILNGIRI